MTEQEQQDASPSELIETGVGLISRGMFRRGDKSGENNPKAAYEDGIVAVGVIRELALNFLRNANLAEKE